MSNAGDLRRLAGEVKSAYEARVNFISETKQEVAAIKQGAANLLDTFGKAHEKMAGALRSDLTRFKSELDGAEKARKNADQAEISERRNYITDLRVKAEEMVNEFDAAHEEMADALRSDLTRFKSELDGAEKARKNADQAEISERRDYITDLRVKAEEMVNEFDAAHEKMAEALRSDLARIKPELKSAESERKAGVRAHMSAVQSEIREMSSAWKELLTAMQSVRGRTVITGAAEMAAGEVTKTAEEVIEEPSEEVAEGPGEEEIVALKKVEEREQLKRRTIDIASANADGIKMTKIAEILDIENWRSLIPVMRELVDEDKLEKEGSLYFR